MLYVLIWKYENVVHVVAGQGINASNIYSLNCLLSNKIKGFVSVYHFQLINRFYVK